MRVVGVVLLLLVLAAIAALIWYGVRSSAAASTARAVQAARWKRRHGVIGPETVWWVVREADDGRGNRWEVERTKVASFRTADPDFHQLFLDAEQRAFDIAADYNRALETRD